MRFPANLDRARTWIPFGPNRATRVMASVHDQLREWGLRITDIDPRDPELRILSSALNTAVGLALAALQTKLDTVIKAHLEAVGPEATASEDGPHP